MTVPGATAAGIVHKRRLPRGTSIEDGPAGARTMRDQEAEHELFRNGDGLVAGAALAKKTWTAGCNAETGEALPRAVEPGVGPVRVVVGVAVAAVRDHEVQLLGTGDGEVQGQRL